MMPDQSKKLTFDELGDANAYIVDLGSTLQLFGNQTENFLKGVSQSWHGAIKSWRGNVRNLSTSKQRALAWACVAQAANRDVQRAVEIMVTAEQLVFDSALSIDPRKLGFDLCKSWAYQNNILSHLEIPEERRRVTWEILNSFNTKEMKNLYGNAYSQNGIHNPYHSGDGKAHDYGFELGDFKMNWFAESYEHPIRAVFYMHLSEIAGVPVVMSETKISYLEELLERGAQEILATIDAHEELKKRVINKSIRNGLLPPIFEMVIVYALKKNISPGEAIIKIRNSSEAILYRQKLVELRMQMNSPTLPQRNFAENYLNKLSDLGKIWARDPYEDIKYMTDTTKTTALLRLVPSAGNLLAQILPSKVKQVLGKRLDNPDPVHLFVSRWFRLDEQKFDEFCVENQ